MVCGAVSRDKTDLRTGLARRPRRPRAVSRRRSAARRLAPEQRAHFRLAEPAVPPGCPDAADAAGCRPPSNRLRVYSEERSHLPGSEKALIVPIHVLPLLISVSEHVLSVAKNIRLLPCFPKNEPLVFVVSFAPDATGLRGSRRGAGRADPVGCARESRPRSGTVAVASRRLRHPITECTMALLTTRCDYPVPRWCYGYHSSGFAGNPGKRGSCRGERQGR
jgi:hypothetical protein